MTRYSADIVFQHKALRRVIKLCIYEITEMFASYIFLGFSYAFPDRKLDNNYCIVARYDIVINLIDHVDC